MEPKFSYREIARLTFGGGYSQREIASAAGCSPASVANIQKRIKATGIDASAALEMGEQELRGLLSRDRGSKPSEKYVQPDFAAVQRQLDLHKGLTLTILWEEYAKRCADACARVRCPAGRFPGWPGRNPCRRGGGLRGAAASWRPTRDEK